MRHAVITRGITAAVVVLLAACDDGVTEPPEAPAPPSISHAIQWAGGTVRVTAETIDSGAVAPPLSMDNASLVAIGTGAGYAEYRLPTSARGAYSLELGGEQPVTFQIQVLGFREVQPLGVALRGNLFVWPRTGAPSLLGIASDNSGVIQVLPASGTTQYLLEESIFDPARSVGPTYDPDVVLVPRGTAEVWRLLPTAAVLDTMNVEFWRHAMLLSDSVYVTSGHHDISAYDPRNPFPALYMAAYEESQGTVISPSGRYGAYRVGGSALGPPVFGPESGEPVFHVDTMTHSDGVDFSPAGDTLYIAGSGAAGISHHFVLAVDANTGHTVGGVGIPGFNPINLVRDAHGPWLFVFAKVLGDDAAPPSLLVIDTRTMDLVGELVTEGYTGCAEFGCEGAVVSGPTGVYFVSTNSTPAAARDIPAVVLSFDNWPVD